jgi:putative PIN family toxin of toxin-antitoxin system
MPHAVIDTNTAISGLLSSGAPAVILRLAYVQQLTLWGCEETVAEFRRVIRYPRIEKRIRSLYRGVTAFEREYERLLMMGSIAGIEPGVLVPDDRDDEMFIRIAIAGHARYIITRDADLLTLQRYKTVSIVTPEEFMMAWRAAHAAAPPPRRWRIPWRRSSTVRDDEQPR